MDEFIKILNSFKDRIGFEPLLFIALAFVSLFFTDKFGDDDNNAFILFMKIIAGGLFSLAILIALLRVISSFFKHRPARGLIDGLVAGLLTGLIGGWLGYGSHNYPHDPVQIRVGICVMFATPIGAIIGVLIDLLHPDRQIQWRKYFGALLLAIILVLSLIGLGIFLFAPDMEAGINVSDLQFLFEFYLVFVLIIVGISFHWPFRKFLARSPIIILAIFLARTPTFFLRVKDEQEHSVLLYKRRFIREFDSFGLERIPTINDQAWAFNLSITVFILILWTYSTYAFYYKDHRFSLWLDQIFRLQPKTKDVA